MTAATPPDTLFTFQVVATQIVSCTMTVQATSLAAAGSIVGDKIRAEDFTGMDRVERSIGEISITRHKDSGA